MIDFTHLDALNFRLSRERIALSGAKSPKEKALRDVWVAQIQREIKAEEAFLGLACQSENTLTDDELMAQLV